MPDVSGQMVDVNGVSIYTKVLGEGPAVLWLHGFTGSHRTFLPFAERVSGFTHVLPDLPGHGHPTVELAPSRVRIPLLVRDLVDLMDHLGHRRFGVVGYSMGGRIALALGAVAPTRVNRLLLESASPGLEGARVRADRRQIDRQRAAAIERDGVPAFIESWARLPLFAAQAQADPDVVAEQQAIRLAQSATGLRASLLGHGTGVQRSYWPHLLRMQFPTMLVTGELDGKFTDTAKHMMQFLPQAVHRRVQGAGHTVHIEAPERFAHVLEEFFSEPATRVEG